MLQQMVAHRCVLQLPGCVTSSHSYHYHIKCPISLRIFFRFLGQNSEKQSQIRASNANQHQRHTTAATSTMSSNQAGSSLIAGESKSFNHSERWGNSTSYCKSPALKRSSLGFSGTIIKRSPRRFSSNALRRSGSLKRVKSGTSLHDIDLTDFLNHFPKQIVRSISESESLSDVVEKLAQWNQFTSTIQDENGRVSGIIDVMDLMSVCYNFLRTSSDMSAASFECTETFSSQQAKEFLTTHGSLLICLPTTAPLSDLISHLSQPEIKRVAVLREGCSVATSHEDIVAIITQAEVLRYLMDNPHLLSSDVKARNCLYSPPPLSQMSCETLRSLSTEAVNKYMTSCAFRAVWNKQITGGVNMQGTRLMDKFINWLTHIIAADIDTDGVEVNPEEGLLEVVKILLEQSTDTVIVTEGTFVMGHIRVSDIMRQLIEGMDELKREI
ncbi:hypothetical protein PROFUN_06661 [Planoprotostelium fungivorum]|uniref:CBS domain-containing protein n=1 Tax=Planoprotostelium fungivorum TaxID=1890364 RepID=A0A2P6MSX7_9EUKA|nr:hypothetical protein PROFUN_06661 [Planoprotostelium fungivorum]